MISYTDGGMSACLATIIYCSEDIMASFEKLEGNQVKLTMSIPAADFEKAIDSAYLKLRKNILRFRAYPASARDMRPRALSKRPTVGMYLWTMRLI